MFLASGYFDSCNYFVLLYSVYYNESCLTDEKVEYSCLQDCCQGFCSDLSLSAAALVLSLR